MARCGCQNECLCVLADGACTQVVGSGSVTSPYKTNVLISGIPDNQIICIPGDGLYVADGGVEHIDSPCIQLLGDGSAATPLQAVLTVDTTDVCNLSSCGPDGLLTKVFTADGECVAITGCGTSGDPLVPEIVLDPNPANVIVCNPGLGLFAPAAAAGAIQYEGEIKLGTFAQVFPGAVASTSGVILFDTVVNDLGGVTDIANNRFLIPVGGAGWYDIESAIQTSGPDNNLAGGSVRGYEGELRVRVNGSAGLRFGWISWPAVNYQATNGPIVQVVGLSVFLNVGDFVDFFFVFNDKSGGVVGAQNIEVPSVAKIIQVGV